MYADRTYHAECTCGCSIVRLETDTVTDDDGVERFLEAYMSIYERQPGGRGLRYRLRAAWHHFRNGVPYRDAVCLSYKDLEGFRRMIDTAMGMEPAEPQRG